MNVSKKRAGVNASNKLDKAVLQSINTDQGKNKSDGLGPWIQDTFSIYLSPAQGLVF